MTDSAVVEVAIGLVLIFVVFSIAVSRINETVLDLLNYRGKNLEAALERFLDGRADGTKNAATEDPRTALSRQLLDGPLQDLRTPKRWHNSPGLTPPGKAKRRPSYISSEAFAHGILDLLGTPGQVAFSEISAADLPATAQDEYLTLTGALSVKSAKALQAAVRDAAAATPLTPAQQAQSDKVDALVTVLGQDRLTQAESLVAGWPDSDFKDNLVALLQRVGLDRDHLHRALVGWYDGVMDRVSGWYKRRVQLFLLGYAVAVTLLFNVDTISVTQVLWANPTVRVAAVSTAQSQVANGQAQGGVVKGGVTESTATALPIGWGSNHLPNDNWWLAILGWLITVFALSFGAPFWFEVLGRFVNMRAGGPKPVSSTSGA